MTEVLEQRFRALTVANEVRGSRARFKRELASLDRLESGRLAARMLVDPPWWMRGMRVRDVLVSVRQVGPSTGPRWLREVGASPLVVVADLDRLVLEGLTARLERRPRDECPTCFRAGCVTDHQECSPRRRGGSDPEFRCGGCGVAMLRATELCGFCLQEMAA